METVITKDQKRTIGEVSIDAKLVYNALKKMNCGDIITYHQLSEIIGRNILKNRNILQTARNMARRENNMVFDCVQKEGLRRLNDSQIVEKTSTHPFRRIRTMIRNANKEMSCVDVEKISNEEVVKMNATRSIFGALTEFAKPKQVESIAAKSAEPLPIAKTLQFFQDS
jgi:hypothetical protein